MRRLYVIYIFLLYCACQSGGNRDVHHDHHLSRDTYGITWMYMPDGDGIPHIAVLEGKPPKESRIDVHEDITFYLYNRDTKDEGKKLVFNETLDKSGYVKNKDTKFIIHGWKSSGDSESMQRIKNSYLEAQDVNVVMVDWSPIADNTFYPIPMRNTQTVGNHLGELIIFMSENGADMSRMHIVGHSLGAHVAGYAGERLKPRSVGRLTGLDPALPGFQYWAGPEYRLDPSDADFVQVIHTCSGVLGYTAPLGDADFYPNGGSPFQPGCCCYPEFIQACSHGRAHEYFAESITTDVGFMAVACDSWDKFKLGRCNETVVEMGEKVPNSARGIFFLETNSSSPFALGDPFDLEEELNELETPE